MIFPAFLRDESGQTLAVVAHSPIENIASGLLYCISLKN